MKFFESFRPIFVIYSFELMFCLWFVIDRFGMILVAKCAGGLGIMLGAFVMSYMAQLWELKGPINKAEPAPKNCQNMNVYGKETRRKIVFESFQHVFFSYSCKLMLALRMVIDRFVLEFFAKCAGGLGLRLC